jgi:hypothetical protein
MNGCACIGNYDLCVNQNATFTRVFTWITQQCCNAAGSQPAPVDLTGYTASMQIKPYALSSTVLYDASANITLGGQAGTITLVIPAAETDDFTWWSGVYDLLLTDPFGVVTRLLSGDVSVCPGVTGTGGSGGGPQYILTPGGQAVLTPSGQGVVTP